MSITAMITEKFPDPGEPQFRFGKQREGVKSTVVRIWPAGGNPWFGHFPHWVNGSSSEVTGLHIWPSTNRIFVVAGGRGYLVDANDPRNWSEAHLSPITVFQSLSMDGLLLISDNLRIAAYSAEKLLWKTSQISWNGIRNLEVSDEHVIGEAWDDVWGAWVSFMVDLNTGEHQGGATFSFDQA